MARLAPAAGTRGRRTGKGVRAEFIAAVRAAEPETDARLMYISDDTERELRESDDTAAWYAMRDETVDLLEGGYPVEFVLYGHGFGTAVDALLHTHGVRGHHRFELDGDELTPVDPHH